MQASILECYEHVTFQTFKRSVVCMIALGHNWFIEFSFNDQDFVLNSR